MARRRVERYWERHPNVYARTTDTWTTRYYNRKSDPMFDLFGLHTKEDDFHKKAGSSPYLTNIRYMGEREAGQRAPAMSRKGARHISTIGEDVFPRLQSEANSYLEFFEGRAIEWIEDHSKNLTGLSFHLQNVGQATGYVYITVRDNDTNLELANAVIDTQSIGQNRFTEHQVRLINAVPDARVLIRAQVLDDVSDEEDRSETREKRSIRILSTGGGVHGVADYTLPNVNESLEEIPYNFVEKPGRPIMGISVNDWVPIPRSYEVYSAGTPYIIYPVRRSTSVEIYRTNKLNGATTLVANNVAPTATAVRFAQGEGSLYYVDGVSPLRRINLTTWAVEDAVPLVGDITVVGVTPASLTAKVGASLIHWMNNRLYLSGYEDDPNLVLMSLIDNVKPRYDQYNDRFYSPDQHPEASAGNPITALTDQSDYLIIFRRDDVSMYDRGGSTILEDASQVTPEGANLGVLNQEAVCKGKNNIFFYNPIEGVQRFGGSVIRSVSSDISNLLDRIKHKENVFMLYHNERVRMYFSFENITPDSCFYYYQELEGRLPWYMDTNTPVSSAVASRDDKAIFAIHSQVPSVMEVDSQLTDFDSAISMEYHTQYHTPPTADPSGWTYARRLHLHEITDQTHSVFIGLDIDHRDSPIVWRKYIEGSEKGEVNNDAVFQHTAEPGTTVISIPIYVKCRNYQVRIKRLCYKDQGEIVGTAIEYGNKEAI